jgi:hypothetical protein
MLHSCRSVRHEAFVLAASSRSTETEHRLNSEPLFTPNSTPWGDVALSSSVPAVESAGVRGPYCSRSGQPDSPETDRDLRKTYLDRDLPGAGACLRCLVDGPQRGSGRPEPGRVSSPACDGRAVAAGSRAAGYELCRTTVAGGRDGSVRGTLTSSMESRDLRLPQVSPSQHSGRVQGCAPAAAGLRAAGGTLPGQSSLRVQRTRTALVGGAQ